VKLFILNAALIPVQLFDRMTFAGLNTFKRDANVVIDPFIPPKGPQRKLGLFLFTGLSSGQFEPERRLFARPVTLVKMQVLDYQWSG